MQIDLTVRNVVKTFGDFTAVDDVTFDVETGKVLLHLRPIGLREDDALKNGGGFL